MMHCTSLTSPSILAPMHWFAVSARLAPRLNGPLCVVQAWPAKRVSSTWSTMPPTTSWCAPRRWWSRASCRSTPPPSGSGTRLTTQRRSAARRASSWSVLGHPTAPCPFGEVEICGIQIMRTWLVILLFLGAGAWRGNDYGIHLFILICEPAERSAHIKKRVGGSFHV